MSFLTKDTLPLSFLKKRGGERVPFGFHPNERGSTVRYYFPPRRDTVLKDNKIPYFYFKKEISKPYFYYKKALKEDQELTDNKSKLPLSFLSKKEVISFHRRLTAMTFIEVPKSLTIRVLNPF